MQLGGKLLPRILTALHRNEVVYVCDNTCCNRRRYAPLPIISRVFSAPACGGEVALECKPGLHITGSTLES